MLHPISTILTLRKLPLLLHIVIESAAAYTFILKPSRQLPPSLLPSIPDQPSSSSPTSPSFCPSSSSSSCPCHLPEETCQQPSKRYLSPSPSSSSSSSSPSPTLPPIGHKAKDEKTTPEAIKELNLILLNYGGLLLTSNLICLIFISRPIVDELSGLVSLCMATYHVWPVWRAWVRIKMSNNDNNGNDDDGDKTSGKEEGKEKKRNAVLGGPVVHLVVHLGLLGGLVLAGLV